MDILNDDFPNTSFNMDKEQSTDPEKYDKLLKEAHRELYPGCQYFSILSSLVELMHMKVECKRTLLKPNVLPIYHSGLKKILKDLGLGYDRIHACTNKCILAYGEFEKLDNCPECNEPTYRKNKILKKVFYRVCTTSTQIACCMKWQKEE